MTIGPVDLLIAITVGVLFLGVLWVLMWLDERADRREEAKPCNTYHPCPECAAEGPSRLDRMDGLRGRDELMP